MIPARLRNGNLKPNPGALLDRTKSVYSWALTAWASPPGDGVLDHRFLRRPRTRSAVKPFLLLRAGEGSLQKGVVVQVYVAVTIGVDQWHASNSESDVRPLA